MKNFSLFIKQCYCIVWTVEKNEESKNPKAVKTKNGKVMLLSNWVQDYHFGNILLDKKLYENPCENILIYDISYKTFLGAKPLRIRFDDGTRYLALFGLKWYDAIYDKIKYLISRKSGIKYSINDNFPRIRIDSYNFFTYRKSIDFS